MALGGSALGSILASAAGVPASIGGFFAQVGTVIAEWAPANIKVLPGAMAAVSGAVSGLGTFVITGDPAELGARLADALTIPADAAEAREYWVRVAGAICRHLETCGQANGTGMSSGVPLTGKGKILFTAPTFIPPLSVVLGVTEPVSAAGLEAFAAQMVAYIQANGAVISAALPGDPPLPPLSAGPDGPVSGTGTIE